MIFCVDQVAISDIQVLVQHFWFSTGSWLQNIFEIGDYEKFMKLNIKNITGTTLLTFQFKPE